MTNAVQEADLTATLHLISLAKSKSTDQRSGWVLVFTTPIDNAALKAENESEPKKVQHGLLKLVRRSMFPDPNAPQTPELVKESIEAKDNGNVTMVFSGRLRRRDISARKESPAYSRWTFTLSNRPGKDALRTLLDMADANGDDVESECEAEFTVKAEGKDDEPRGPELFDDADEMSEEDKKLLAGDDSDPKTQAGVDHFDERPESNRHPIDPETGERKPVTTLKKGEFEEEAAKKSRKRKPVKAA